MCRSSLRIVRIELDRKAEHTKLRPSIRKGASKKYNAYDLLMRAIARPAMAFDFGSIMWTSSAMRALLTCAYDQTRLMLIEVCVVGLEGAVISGTVAGCVVDDSMGKAVHGCWILLAVRERISCRAIHFRIISLRLLSKVMRL